MLGKRSEESAASSYIAAGFHERTGQERAVRESGWRCRKEKTSEF